MHNWIQQLRKGLAEFLVLAVLEKGEMHGYAVLQELGKLETLALTESAIYPLLSRLRKKDLLKSRMEKSTTGPPRRVYSLTVAGRLNLRQMQEYWGAMCGELDQILSRGQD